MGKGAFVFLAAIVAVSAFFLLRDKGIEINSPIPKVFGTVDKNLPENNWYPQAGKARGSELDIAASSALAVDYENGKVIFEKDLHTRLPVASTVKIMTALLAFEGGKLTDVYIVSEKAAKIGENSMGLEQGERLTLEELLYGLMLVSGNDAAVAIAEGIAGSEEKFVEMMNEKVSFLGLRDTRFINASGLDEEGKEQYSSAYDLSVIAHYLWENYPAIRDVTSTYNKFIEANDNHKAFDLYNDTNLLTTYPGVRGIKPGFTWEAGLCLVTYAENEGKKVLAVILGSDDRRGQMKELLDYSFSSFGITVSHPDLDL